jgi:hypothetical protein
LTDVTSGDLAAAGSLGHLVTTAPSWYTAPSIPPTAGTIAAAVLAATPTFASQASVTLPTVGDCLAAAWVETVGAESINSSANPPTWSKLCPDGATVFRVFNLDSATAPTTRT